MDIDQERIALRCVVGVSGAAVAARTSRERNQQINLVKKFDEIAEKKLELQYDTIERLRSPSAAPHRRLGSPQARGILGAYPERALRLIALQACWLTIAASKRKRTTRWNCQRAAWPKAATFRS